MKGSVFNKDINKHFRWKGINGKGFVPKVVEDLESTSQEFEIEEGTYYMFGTLEELSILNILDSIYPVVIWFKSSIIPTTLILPIITLPSPHKKKYLTTKIDIQANKFCEISIINRHIVCVEFE